METGHSKKKIIVIKLVLQCCSVMSFLGFHYIGVKKKIKIVNKTQGSENAV